MQESRGEVLQIPMPGHPTGPGQRQDVITAINRLQQLIADHDVIFLLTDSRESRWLPSLMGAAQNKVRGLRVSSYLDKFGRIQNPQTKGGEHP